MERTKPTNNEPIPKSYDSKLGPGGTPKLSITIFGPCQYFGSEILRLGSVNYHMDKNSIFWVHKSEERKIRGIWCGSPKH